jgi:hypothetical protein
MTDKCVAAIHMATGGVFSDEEADAFLTRLANQAKRAKREAPTLTDKQAIAEAAKAVTKDELREALIARRTRIAAEIARDEVRRPKLEPLVAKLGPARALEAINVGSERQVAGSSSSIDAEGRARQMLLWGLVDVGLSKMPGLKDRLSNFWGVGERGFDRLVAKEMARLTGAPGVEPTGDEGALHAARVFVAALEASRKMQNDVGAWIDRAEGYIGRQAHDANKIAGRFYRELGELGRRVQASGVKDFDWAAARSAAEARSFGEWRDFIRPKLDEGKTFGGIDAGDVYAPEQAKALAARGILEDPSDAAELMLHRIWTDVVTGHHDEISGGSDLGDFRPKASLARTVSKARVLHFKDSDAWLDYAERYGRSSLFATVMHQLERSGRNAALMKVWGPAPEAAFQAEVSRLAQQARDAGDVAAAKSLQNPMVKARFEAVNGMADTPANMRLALVMRNIRSWEALTKLGSIVLSKATDLPITASVFKRVGGTWLGGYRAAFLDGILRLSSPEAKAAAEALDVGARSFAGHLGGQYLASDGASGWLSWGVKTLYRINGFEALNNSVRHGAAVGYARLLGGLADTAFEDLPTGVAETFERFGIGREDWDNARVGIQPAADGVKYFTLDRLRDANASGAAAENGAALKWATMVHNILDDTVSEPRARERSFGNFGTRPGTVTGELMRTFWQFKSFVNTIVGRHLVPAAKGYAGLGPVSVLAHLILGTTLAGYVSMNAKALSRGELPRGPLGEDGYSWWKVWAASMAQGGGLGVYGDFLFGDINRNGRDFDWGQLGGPALGDSEAVAKIVQQAIAGGDVSETTGRSPIPAEALRIGAQNIPLVNLWYTRLAIDYLVLWRMQEAISPGYLQRYEANVRNRAHSGFWLHPTSAE